MSQLYQGNPTRFFFCKPAVRRSKYWLEISNARETLKISGWQFICRWHSEFNNWKFPTVFGGCVQFHINFHNQDIAIIVKERYSEKFRYETKRPLGFLNESTATPWGWTFNRTHQSRFTKLKVSDETKNHAPKTIGTGNHSSLDTPEQIKSF